MSAGALASPPFAGMTCLGETLGPVPLGDVPEHAERTFVRMSDGVRLATDVYLPASRRRRATVLVRLPYDIAGDHAWVPEVAARLVDDGFAFVAQDVRGKGASEGAAEAFVAEAADGADTLDWIEAQPWSDGRVGMWGQSYFGFTQWAAASTGHRALRCIVPQMTASDVGTEWMYRDGVFQMQTMVEWAAWAWVAPELVVHRIDWKDTPVSSLVDRWTGRGSESYSAWVRSGPTGAYWRRLYPGSSWHGRLRAAVLGAGGFWDAFARGQIRDFRTIRRRAPRLSVRLWLAARDHFGSEWTPPQTPSPDYEADPALKEEAVTRYLGPAPEWYREWLGPDGARAEPAVRFQVAGEGWRHSPTWPPAGARRTTLHLGAGSALLETPEPARPVSIPYDPAQPVPTLDDNPWRVLFRPADRSALARRPDVLCFETPPLDQPMVLAGPVAVTVTASAHGGAGTLHANLVDVWPDGVARRLASGVCRVRRGGGPIRIDVGHACCRLEPGRRLRLELAASDFPRHPRPSGDESALTAATLRPGEIRLRLGAEARLTLTVVDP